jgi:gluconokinase
MDEGGDDQSRFRAAVDEHAPEVPVVVMGVAGCGKTSVGRLLATELGASFIEADELHPPANKEKMSRGTPLTDEDRRPWLEEIAGRIRDHADQGVVVACSALKRSYRDILRGGHAGTFFLHLELDRDTATRRVGSRPGHFMPAALVASQFEALEPLDRDEAGLGTDATKPVAEIVAEARTRLRR